MSDSLRPHGLQHARLPCPSPTPGACSNSSPLSQWCHPTISSSVIPFSSCLQSFPASGSFQMSRFFTSGGQSIRISASGSVLPMNIQDWFPLGWTGWISLLSKGSREGHGNPLQCSCLENPRDGGAWWAAIYGVAQSQTWLKRLKQQQQQLSKGLSRVFSNTTVQKYQFFDTQLSL